MTLIALELRNIRVYDQAKISPDPFFNLIWGANASGKTSLLEAIHLLGTGRSYRTKHLDQLRKHDTEGLSARGLISGPNQTDAQVVFSYNAEGRRILLNGLPQNQVSTVAQLFPLQVISPDSHYEFRSSARHRRGALDWGLFHVEPDFLDLWARYQRQLHQRNAALKSPGQHNAKRVWDEGLATLGEEVQALRARLLALLKVDFLDCCRMLLGSEQQADLVLESGWQAGLSLANCLQQDSARDLARGFTHSGPHRADLRIVLRSGTQEVEASHGQYKLLVLALRLSLIRRFVETKSQSCCLLIDDLAAEIDADHRARLTSFLSQLPIQLFVTATDATQIDLAPWPSHKSFHVEHGQLKELVAARNNRAAAR